VTQDRGATGAGGESADPIVFAKVPSYISKGTKTGLRTAGPHLGQPTGNILASRSGFRFFYVPHINNRPLKASLSYAKLKLNRRVGRQLTKRDKICSKASQSDPGGELIS
jgi:hypothetical protein